MAETVCKLRGNLYTHAVHARLVSMNEILQGLKKILYDMIGDESTTSIDGNFRERRVVS